MRLLLVAISGAVAGCDSGNSGGGSAVQVDHSLLTTSSSEVALADGGSMAFSITSVRYKQWDAAGARFPGP